MRAATLIIALFAALLPSPTLAQVLLLAPPPPQVNQEGMRSFCIWGNQIY